MQHIRRLFIGLSLMLLLSACTQSSQAPDPSLTAIGDGQSRDSADWINPEDIARAESLGLTGRDADMSAAALGTGNQIEDMFEPVYFDFDQSFIRPEDRSELQEVYEYLSNNRNAQLLIEGHCDWRGTTEYNMALGDRRAGSVKSYLVNLGIDEDRMETVSKGDLEAVKEGTEEEMQEDRRADLIVLPGDS